MKQSRRDNTIEYLKVQEGYIRVRELKDNRLIGLLQMAFTMALVIDLTRHGGYAYRYCYTDNYEALQDFESWDGKGHPPGNWIKRKGLDGDLINENYKIVTEAMRVLRLDRF